jgi:DNA polymerase-3 subunit gamma/tau
MTDRSLAILHRPRKFEELIGQKPVAALLKAMTVKGTLPHVLLLEGCKGAGKTTTARIVGAALNCESFNKPCGECESCISIFEGNSLAVREIDASSHGLVDDIRQLQDSLIYSIPGITSVIIIDEAQGLSKAASNALLKTLEFPPENTVFILITTEVAKIIPTIRSRCMIFSFKQIAPEAIFERLKTVRDKENLSISDDIIYQAALRSGGSLRDGLILLDQLVRAGVSKMDQFQAIFGESLPGVSLLKAILSGRHSLAYTEADRMLATVGSVSNVVDSLVELLKNIVVIRSGGLTPLQGEDLKHLQQIASNVDSKKAVAALRSLWDTKIKIRGNDQSAGMMYLMITAVLECLTVPVFTDSGTLTFDDMRSTLS